MRYQSPILEEKTLLPYTMVEAILVRNLVVVVKITGFQSWKRAVTRSTGTLTVVSPDKAKYSTNLAHDSTYFV